MVQLNTWNSTDPLFSLWDYDWQNHCVNQFLSLHGGVSFGKILHIDVRCYDIDTQHKSSSISCVLVVEWFWLWKAFFSIYGEGIGEIIILCQLYMNVFCMNLVHNYLVSGSRLPLTVSSLIMQGCVRGENEEYKEFIEENKWENFKLGDALISWSNFVPSKESSWIMPSIFSVMSHIDQLHYKLYKESNQCIGYGFWISFFWISMIL